MVRLTLKVASRAGPFGVRLDLLKDVYQALGLEPTLADAIERKLTVDGVGYTSAGRLYFGATRGLHDRLAAEKTA
jgi:hypothetical protein